MLYRPVAGFFNKWEGLCTTPLLKSLKTATRPSIGQTYYAAVSNSQLWQIQKPASTTYPLGNLCGSSANCYTAKTERSFISCVVT